MSGNSFQNKRELDSQTLIAIQDILLEHILSNKWEDYEDFARESGHLTPSLLQQELACFQNIKGYLPQVVTVHMNPMQEAEIGAEIAAVSKTLNNAVIPGYEGMQIRL